MNKFVIGVASVIIIGLSISTFYYEGTRKEGPQLWSEQSPQLATEDDQTETLQPIYTDEQIGYSLQNNQLQITFDQGVNWVNVPVELDQLFSGEFNGNREELIEHSYILNEKRTAFLYSEGLAEVGKRVVYIYSTDQGQNWEKTIVTEPYPSMRFRKVAFLSDKFGYIIVSGDRTMSQEMSNVFLTYDGGRIWKETNRSGVTTLLSDGGFIDERVGFLSFSYINPLEPILYVTEDAGNTWESATIDIPEKYLEIFVTAEMPYKENDHLAMLLNQGPNGDYLGGKVKGKFISNDGGENWEFAMEVDPDKET
ncbi:WD40/YVTN/BNR-like repeat-containing protein [Lederbergia galactosidilytica]|uniref:Oxidoreductase n=1 Tax=Lederbergia galactosidilytica TaxID=217031 RepID=A0A177ZM74_9BACI|nr:oxidoreductase [Lederbergia galactosidilytica]MBP1916105.1 photosystem II stability/assembly factor-like uncharacterized protein [Lederbergia galactosidilytica]OAK68440.1 oxidoreductase [Lederbergia galactosidilytica]